MMRRTKSFASIRHGMLAVLTTVATVTALAITTPAAPAETGGGSLSTSPTQTGAIAWTACNESFFCGTLAVPLDYDRPRGPQISVALIKLPATDPSRRIGSLFVNPGGPGGSGVDFVLGLGTQLFTPDVRARFDIVGFDPRGIAHSTPLKCFATQDDAAAATSPIVYPNTPARKRIWIANERLLDQSCADRGGLIIDHMSTANVARDMDRMRQAVGDRLLSYYGVSYGSFLGNEYANIFPNRFRALVIDGVLDPVAWTTGRGGDGRRVPFSTRLRSDVGAQDTLRQFFRLCDARPDNCALAPHSPKRYRALYNQLAEHPVPVTFPDGTTVSYDESFLVGETLGALYDSASWPGFASYLADFAAAHTDDERAHQAARLLDAADEPDYVNYLEGFPGVACSDSINPAHYRAWSQAARASERNGYFGPVWTWASSVCAEWPGRDHDRYLGPFTHRTAEPVLVVGNLYDPATPYQGAVTADRLLPNSRLLTVKAWGHTSLFTSSCADDAIARYLLTSRPPARGAVCNQDLVPFTQAAPSARAAAARSTLVPRTPRW